MENMDANVYSEVLGILNNLPQAALRNIPAEILENIRKNCNNEYIFKYDIYKSLNEQNVLEGTKTMIAILFRDYWATDEQKEKIFLKEKADRLKIEEEKKSKYNVDDLFKKSKVIEETVEEKSLVELKKEPFYKIIFNKIKKILNIKK